MYLWRIKTTMKRERAHLPNDPSSESAFHGSWIWLRRTPSSASFTASIVVSHFGELYTPV
jgi:hypothetical protein